MEVTPSPTTYITFNNFKIKNIEPYHIHSYLLQCFDDLQYWSYDALKKIFFELPEIVIDYCDELLLSDTCEDRKKIKSCITKMKKCTKYPPQSQQTMLARLYDMILADDGLTTLNGFGFEYGMGDPEKKRLSKNHNIKVL